MLLKLAWSSLLNRKIMVLLTVLSIAISVFVMLGVEHIRTEARNSFSKTVSGTDLIVGARTGPLNLLLYSVFRVGSATNNMSWSSYQALLAHRQVDWAIPISLGDSHRGYRVMGTTEAYFERFLYGDDQALVFTQGREFQQVLDAVLGFEVAKKLGYQIGDSVVLSHGLVSTGFSNHDDKPFTVVGILAPTGTPVDQTVHVSLAGIEAIHLDWQNGVRLPGRDTPIEEMSEHDLTPQSITAVLVGLKSKIATFSVQRDVNRYSKEALMAVLPGVALSELWQMLRGVEGVLRVISALVLLASLMGMATMLLASLRERQRELAILRAVGAGPWFVFGLIQLEVLLITLLSIVAALLVLSVSLWVLGDVLSVAYGLFISPVFFTSTVVAMLGVILFAALSIGLLPAITAYRGSLHQGLLLGR